MKKFVTSALALVLVLATMLSFTSCHKQGAVVAQLDDDSVSSGMYLIFLINADNEARTKVTEQNKDNKDFNSTTADFYSMKVQLDDKDKTEVDFEEYVRNQAEKYLKQYLYIRTLATEKKVEMDEDEISEAKSMANYYWYYYGYGSYYEPNGISYQTYEQYFLRQQLSYKVFKTLYKVGGEKGVKETQLQKAFKENYLIADTVTVPLSTTDSNGKSTNFTDAEKAEAKKKLDGYAEKLNKKEITFEEVYVAYNGEDKTQENTSSESDEPQPKDKRAVVYGSEKTSATTTDYKAIAKLIKDHGFGYAAVIENTDLNRYSLVVTADIMSDEYYYNTYVEDVTSMLFSDEYQEDVDAAAEKLKVSYDDYELDYLDPEKITYQTNTANG